MWVTYADGTKASVDPAADSDAELTEMLRSAAARFGLSERRFDVSHPELDLRLPDGSRLSALISVVQRPVVSIRRHRYVDLTLDDLVEMGALDPTLASFLTAAVQARKNIVVGGAMNSGKTTLIRALAAAIPPRERVVTIEQAFELGLDSVPDRHPDLVALESRPANAEGEGAISMARLVRRALRMNADRVIVGEVRALLQALADRLLSGGPVRANGVARTLVLLRDGTGPLYDERRTRELVSSLNEALDDLDL